MDNQDDVFVLANDYSIIEEFDAPYGKFANNFGNVVVIDAQYLLGTASDIISENLSGLVDGGLLAAAVNSSALNVNFSDINLYDYALQVDVVLKGHEEYYMGTPESNQRKLIDVQTELNLDIALESTAPVQGALEGLEFIKLFLQSTFMTIVFFMVLLSVMLIYSLMIADVDEKTYEMGMLRALGLRRASIVHVIILQSIMFSVIGLTIGFIISATLNASMRWYVFTNSKNSTTYWMSVGAALSGLLVGACMPMISNVWAIKRALGKKIRDSLDIFHNGINDVMVQVIKLQNFGLSLFEITLGISLSAMGIVTYYFVPAAFMYDRLDLFFFILNLILISMIIGLAFLSFLIFQYVQVGIVYLITWVLR